MSDDAESKEENEILLKYEAELREIVAITMGLSYKYSIKQDEIVKHFLAIVKEVK